MRAGNALAPPVRAAHPDDGPACIPLIAKAGGTLLSWGLGDAPPESCTALVRRCWELGRHPLGPRSSCVIEVEGRVVACCVGASARTWVEEENVHRIVIEDLVPRPAVLRRRIRTQARARPPLDPRAWYLASLGVASDHRRRGLGHTLLEHAEERARAAGCQHLLVEVVADNAPALALYRTCGFRQAAVWRAGSGPRVLRLVAPIEG